VDWIIDLLLCGPEDRMSGVKRIMVGGRPQVNRA
jgi:hypothetical protein